MATLQELLAASALIVTCERIAASGALPEAEEQSLRALIVRTGKAFALPSIAERQTSNVIQIGDHAVEYDQLLDRVAREIGA